MSARQDGRHSKQRLTLEKARFANGSCFLNIARARPRRRRQPLRLWRLRRQRRTGGWDTEAPSPAGPPVTAPLALPPKVPPPLVTTSATPTPTARAMIEAMMAVDPTALPIGAPGPATGVAARYLTTGARLRGAVLLCPNALHPKAKGRRSRSAVSRRAGRRSYRSRRPRPKARVDTS